MTDSKPPHPWGRGFGINHLAGQLAHQPDRVGQAAVLHDPAVLDADDVEAGDGHAAARWRQARQLAGYRLR